MIVFNWRADFATSEVRQEVDAHRPGARWCCRPHTTWLTPSGDSLVYWRVNAHEAATAHLVGHRDHARARPVFFTGNLTVEAVSKADLTCTRAYSDIDDRERFEDGALATIPTGGVAVVEIDEAYRVVADAAHCRGTARDSRRLFLPQQVVFVRLDVCFAPLRGMACSPPPRHSP